MMQFFGKITSKLRGVKTLKYVPSEYKCQLCKESKVLNESNFQRVKNFKYGFSTYCNECDEKSKKIKKNLNNRRILNGNGKLQN